EVSVLLPTLQQALKDKVPENRAAAATVMGMIGAKTKAAVSALGLALKDADLGVRSEAVAALGEIGPAARAAIPALLAATEQADYEFIEPLVAITLGKIGKEAVPALTEALAAKNVKLKRTAAAALGLVGTGAAGAVSELAAALADPEAAVRQYAAQALGQI